MPPGSWWPRSATHTWSNTDLNYWGSYPRLYIPLTISGQVSTKSHIKYIVKSVKGDSGNSSSYSGTITVDMYLINTSSVNMNLATTDYIEDFMILSRSPS
jgi:hypothetical protein